MLVDLGVVKPGSTLRLPFSSFDKDDGSSITMTNFLVADILVYKDGSTTERASTSGYTATTDFDAKTGKHLIVIDLSDDTTADFWKAGSEYLVAIDAVTVDLVTVGGWIARFRIGYPGAILDTSIATLASQTSFTLTTGPAENDAIKGRVVLIHNKASAVQAGYAVISAYTGSTKTVTLAAGTTFTAAVGDNISIMDLAPLQPATLGRTLVVDAAGLADANAVKVGPSGSGTAQTAGDIPARLPAALVSGRMDSSTGAMAANVLTAAAINAAALNGKGDWNIGKTGYALSAAGVQAIWDALTSALTTVGSVGKRIADFLTGDAYVRLGAPAGASVSADIAAVKTDTAAIKAKTDNLPAAPAAVSDIPTANTVADALLDRANGIETALTPRQAFRLMASALAGKLSGAGTTSIAIRNVGDSKDRITATVDASGNRTAVTTDGT